MPIPRDHTADPATISEPTDPDGPPAAVSQHKRGVFAQPKRFWNLTFIDLWERFSFYSLQALLAYYLLAEVGDGGLAVGAAVVASVTGAYGAIAQLSQIVGSWIADRMVAPKKLVLFGACLIAAGHVSLGVLPGFVGLFVGLGFVLVGTGAFKTNLTRILGTLYDENPEWDIRRDAGFTFYLAATNAGAVLGPFIAGVFEDQWGFHAGFAVAAAGMFVGLAQYAVIYRRLPSSAATIANPISRRDVNRLVVVIAGLAVAAAILFYLGLLDGERLSTTVGIAVVAVIVSYYVVMFRSGEVTRAEKTRLRGLFPVSVAGLVFWGFAFQCFTTVPLFVTDHVDLGVGGWTVPELWFASALGVGSIVMSFAASALWTRLGERQPPAMSKIVIAFTLAALGFAGIGVTTTLSTETPAVVLLGCLFLVGGAEAFIGPLIFSLGTKYMPEKFKTQGLAVMALSIGGGSVLAGIWGSMYTTMSPSAYFYLMAAVAVGCGVVIFLIARWTQRLLDTFE